MNDLKINDEDSTFYNYKYICDFANDYKKCEENLDFHDLIKEASYSIDIEKQKIFMSYIKSDFFTVETNVEAYIPFDLFTLKNEAIIPSE